MALIEPFPNFEYFVYGFAIFGLLILVSFILNNTLGPLYRLLTIPFRKSRIQRYGPGSWALVTGASDGIGKGFCHQLAKEGFNIVLVARNKEKLERVAAELREEVPDVLTRIVVFDFKYSAEEGAMNRITKEVEDLDVSLLINNVGMDLLDYFHRTPDEKNVDLITVNLIPAVLLTKAFISRMLERKLRSAILTVGSGSAYNPLPYGATYAASKIFIQYFSRGMSVEYPQIDFLCLEPFFVSTNMNHNKKIGTLGTVHVKSCVSGALRDLGYKELTYGACLHKIVGWVVEMMPYFIMKRALKDGSLKEMVGRGIIPSKKAYKKIASE